MDDRIAADVVAARFAAARSPGAPVAPVRAAYDPGTRQRVEGMIAAADPMLQPGLRRDVRRLRFRIYGEWIAKGVIGGAVVYGPMIALALSIGYHRWMVIGGFISAAFCRAWWRARPMV